MQFFTAALSLLAAGSALAVPVAPVADVSIAPRADTNPVQTILTQVEAVYASVKVDIDAIVALGPITVDLSVDVNVKLVAIVNAIIDVTAEVNVAIEALVGVSLTHDQLALLPTVLETLCSLVKLVDGPLAAVLVDLDVDVVALISANINAITIKIQILVNIIVTFTQDACDNAPASEGDLLDIIATLLLDLDTLLQDLLKDLAKLLDHLLTGLAELLS